MFYGTLEATANTHLNSFDGRNMGYMTVKFYKTNNEIKFINPTIVLSGTTYGDR